MRFGRRIALHQRQPQILRGAALYGAIAAGDEHGEVPHQHAPHRNQPAVGRQGERKAGEQLGLALLHRRQQAVAPGHRRAFEAQAGLGAQRGEVIGIQPGVNSLGVEELEGRCAGIAGDPHHRVRHDPLLLLGAQESRGFLGRLCRRRHRAAQPAEH